MALDVRAIADAIGYPFAGLGILVESLGFPVPGELTLVAAAAYAAAGHLDIRLVALAGGLSAVLAGDLGYLAGYAGGRPFVERFSHLVHVNPGHLARSEMFFTRYGGRTILFGRFVLGLRTWACVLAGMAHMPFWTFQAYSAVGALLWAVLVGLAGFYLGSNWSRVQDLARTAGLSGLVVVAFLILAGLLLQRRA
jgi:membrane protein DedA with SNARE-associated domain